MRHFRTTAVRTQIDTPFCILGLTLAMGLVAFSAVSSKAQILSEDYVEKLAKGFEAGETEAEDQPGDVLIDFDRLKIEFEDIDDEVTDNSEELLPDEDEALVNDGVLLSGFFEKIAEEFGSDGEGDEIDETSTELIDFVALAEHFESEIDNEVAEAEVVEEAPEPSVADEIDEDFSPVEDGPSDQPEMIDENGLSSLGDTEQVLVDTAEDSAEGQVEEQLEEVVVGEAENDVEESIDLGPGLDDQNPEEDADQVIGASNSDELNNPNIDETIDSTETTIAADDARIHLGQWLVMAEPQAFTQLAAEGYVFDAMTDLPSLGLKLAEVSAPASFDISLARAGVYDVVGSDGAEVDLNHFYTARHPGESDVDVGISPREAMSLPDSAYELALRIGIIDSAVDTRHPVFSSSTINSKRFTRSENDIPDFHGTAIASLLVANNDDMVGLVPQATLYSAAVFDMDSNKGEIASTVSLVRSLDWLLEKKVDVINLSLTGPSNRLLEVAINKVVDAGIVVLAAAGNDGPMATPKYPAAYSSVIAVTAVDSRGRAFRMANRGDYLALAAPGVNLRHAQPGRGYTVSSGTSFAVPFVTAVAALLKHLEPGGDVVSRLYASAMDLGAPGRDEIYGYGLLRAE